MPIDLDLYFPVFTVLQFFFFMGLLKVTLFHSMMTMAKTMTVVMLMTVMMMTVMMMIEKKMMRKLIDDEGPHQAG